MKLALAKKSLICPLIYDRVGTWRLPDVMGTFHHPTFPHLSSYASVAIWARPKLI
ncbi:hypothetical protein BX600DRAFT_455649 [Xylariales sp. PMI_506]|nr:hypothetical protein BX600DRAFT_455649 [Xylariales sp. PMI_506]